MTLHQSTAPHSTGFYAVAADGRRTRIYADKRGAVRAAERGEWYTDEEYAALTTITHRAATAARGKRG